MRGGIKGSSGFRSLGCEVKVFDMFLLEVEITHRHKTDQAPVRQEQRGANRDSRLERKRAKDQAGKEIAQGNSLEHTHPANMIHTMSDSAVNQQAEDVNSKT